MAAFPRLANLPRFIRPDGRAPVTIVVATTASGGIGLNGDLPWSIPADLAFFEATSRNVRDQALQNAVIMGRKTWESLPRSHRPLPGRRNAVLTRSSPEAAAVQLGIASGSETAVFSGLEDCIAHMQRDDSIETVHVIGGGALYTEATGSALADLLLVTVVSRSDGAEIVCDARMEWPLSSGAPYFQAMTGPILEEGGFRFAFHAWARQDGGTVQPPASPMQGYEYRC